MTTVEVCEIANINIRTSQVSDETLGPCHTYVTDSYVSNIYTQLYIVTQIAQIAYELWGNSEVIVRIFLF